MIISPSIAWLLIGILLIIVEVIGLPGIGFIFASLGAITLGGLMVSDIVVVEGLLDQVAYFLFFTIVWAVILWKPLKRSLKNPSDDTYQNIVGSYGETTYGALKVGKVGYIKWSGTRIRARIRPESDTKIIKERETVFVHGQSDGILFVDTMEADLDKINNEEEE